MDKESYEKVISRITEWLENHFDNYVVIEYREDFMGTNVPTGITYNTENLINDLRDNMMHLYDDADYECVCNIEIVKLVGERNKLIRKLKNAVDSLNLCQCDPNVNNVIQRTNDEIRMFDEGLMDRFHCSYDELMVKLYGSVD